MQFPHFRIIKHYSNIFLFFPLLSTLYPCVFQVQVILWYLQCHNLPDPQILVPHDTEAEDS